MTNSQGYTIAAFIQKVHYVMILIISQIAAQLKTLYLFSGIRQSVRYMSAVDGDVSGTHLGVGEVASDGRLMSFSGVAAALAFVSAAKIR